MQVIVLYIIKQTHKNRAFYKDVTPTMKFTQEELENIRDRQLKFWKERAAITNKRQ